MDLKKVTLVRPDMLQIKNYEILGKLPDPFVCEDGHRITGPEEWPARRKELYRSVIELQYGTMPPANEVLEVEPQFIGKVGHSSYRIICGPAQHPVSFRMKLIMPEGAENPPVIVDGDMCFGYAMDRDWLNAALDKGIAWALFDRTELAHDVRDEGRGKGQLYEAYPEYTFGAIGAWAWGYSRVVDALTVLGRTDNTCIAFSGHSRGAKTAMLAGALDERAAIVNPNNSNAGSCSCYRSHIVGTYENTEEKRSERLSDLWRRFSFWLGPEMEKYIQSEEELPFDCHELKAMIAPRTLLVGEAAGDLWTNPVGTWQTTMAAKEVYRFLGAEKELFWYFRAGGHKHLTEDVERLTALIERRRDGKEVPAEAFFHTPFDETKIPQIFDWHAPER